MMNFKPNFQKWDLDGIFFFIAQQVFFQLGIFIVKKNYIEDQLYVKMCNIYLLANAIWILVIRANFSNRFAYLSWFYLD